MGFDAGSFGAVKGFDQSGGAQQLRPFFRSQQLLQCALEQRGDWQGKASVGASCPQGCLFQQCHSEHGEKDAAGFAVGGGTFGVEGQGDYTHSIPGALWWFWSLQGHRVHHLAGCDVPQSYDGRESCSSQIQPESPLCVPGADCNGLWEHASWVASFTYCRRIHLSPFSRTDPLPRQLFLELSHQQPINGGSRLPSSFSKRWTLLPASEQRLLEENWEETK